MSESAYWNQMYANALEGQRPFILLRPRISIDGNQWCALYGENLQDGVAGFGDSPELAAWDFDKAWCEKIKAKSDEKITPNSEIKLHPAVMEAIDSYAKYYAEHHKIGLSVRNDMMYVAEVAVRWADAKGASDTVAVPVAWSCFGEAEAFGRCSRWCGDSIKCVAKLEGK